MVLLEVLPITEIKLGHSLLDSCREIIADNSNHNNSRDSREYSDARMKTQITEMDQMIMNPPIILRIDSQQLYL